MAYFYGQAQDLPIMPLGEPLKDAGFTPRSPVRQTGKSCSCHTHPLEGLGDASTTVNTLVIGGGVLFGLLYVMNKAGKVSSR